MFNYRPVNFQQYIGQENIKSNLKVFIEASIIEEKALDHVILHGASGLGKTSLAYVIANEMQSNLHTLHGPNLQKPSDIISCLTQLKPNDIVFIDEVHSVAKEVEEILYPVIDHNKLHLIIGKDYTSKVINVDLPKFTLICATTNISLLNQPFLNRFSINFHLTNYCAEEISLIIFNCAKAINLSIDSQIAKHLALFTRLNPRVAINLVKRIKDYSLVMKLNDLSISLVNDILTRMNIYQDGLTVHEIKYLQAIYTHFNNSPAGIESICQIINEPVNIVLNIIEPFLLLANYLQKTARGRLLTVKAVNLVEKLAKNY